MPQASSLPVRGAWVEIVETRSADAHRGSRSPCGERGLKYTRKRALPHQQGSLPVRGAWVEILPNSLDRIMTIVAPRAGSVG